MPSQPCELPRHILSFAWSFACIPIPPGQTGGPNSQAERLAAKKTRAVGAPSNAPAFFLASLLNPNHVVPAKETRPHANSLQPQFTQPCHVPDSIILPCITMVSNSTIPTGTFSGGPEPKRDQVSWVTPNKHHGGLPKAMQRTKRVLLFGWDCPLLPFIWIDCGSIRVSTGHTTLAHMQLGHLEFSGVFWLHP